MIPFFLQFFNVIFRRRPRQIEPQWPPRYWMDGREVSEAEYKGEIAAMSSPPRNTWGGAKTEQEWLDLQTYFAANQAKYDQMHREGLAASSNTRFGLGSGNDL